MFFHGNAEDIGWSISFVRTLQKRLKVSNQRIELVFKMEYCDGIEMEGQMNNGQGDITDFQNIKSVNRQY